MKTTKSYFRTHAPAIANARQNVYALRAKEAALKIRAEADRDAVTILSEGKRKALEIEGKAGRLANLLTTAYGKDKKNFEFYKK